MADLLRPYPAGEPTKRRKTVSNKIASNEHLERMYGILEGIIADGEVNYREADYLKQWLHRNERKLGSWPSEPLYYRLSNFLEDQELDLSEQAELIQLIREETKSKGGPRVGYLYESANFDPLPETFEIRGATFCFSGTCRAGKRSHLERLMQELGASCCGGPKQKGCVVVVGSLGYNDAEKHSKIHKAQDYRAKGHPVLLVSEQDWWSLVRQYFNGSRQSEEE